MYTFLQTRIKCYLQGEKIQILIIGGGSKIARETFKLQNQYDIVGFSRFSKTKKITEFKVKKFRNYTNTILIITSPLQLTL